MELISVDLNKNMVELNVEDDSPKNECVSYRFANGFFSIQNKWAIGHFVFSTLITIFNAFF